MNGKAILKHVFASFLIIILACTLQVSPVRAANAQNPIIWADAPDVSVIRVGSNYYMSSTTMHMNPGVPIMKSTNLVDWEIVNYVYPTLGNGDRENLNNGQNEYGKGSWASTLRYKNGIYYAAFMSYTSNNTYVYQTTNIETGPWTRYALGAAYHDPSLLFDDDARVYLVYGGGDIKVVELTSDAKAVKSGGLQKTLITNAGSIAGTGGLAAEGSHAFKINGKYYIFLISWPSGGSRTELVYRADSFEGAYQGQVLLKNGIAQGGVVDTADGKWYAMLFADSGAVGRIPSLIPVTWSNNWPVLGSTTDTGIPAGAGSKFAACDGFDSGTGPGLMWQWNHNPDNNYWSYNSARPGYFRLTNGSVRADILAAKNTLTQRTFGGESSAIVAMETGGMKDGDYAGLSAFQFYYGFVGVKMSGTSKSIVMVRGSTNDATQASSPVEIASVPVTQNRVYLKVYTDFRSRTDKAYFYYSLDGSTWTAIGSTLQMAYTLPHFMGYRFGLFTYATKSAGGYADFDYFTLNPAPAGGCSIAAPTYTPTSAACILTAITPYIQVNAGAWTQASSVTVASLPATVNLGPQPVTGGAWSWSGPNGFTSTLRQIDGVPLSAGTNVFTATYTNDCGAKSTQAFTITVQAAATATNTFTRTATPAATATGTATPAATNITTGGLRDLAAAKGMLLGAEATSNPLHNETLYRDTLAKEFNWMGGENEFKAYLWTGPYTYNFTTTDYYRDFRDAKNMQMRGHVLAYYTVIPGWLSSGTYTNAQVSDMLRAYITAMAGRYSGKMNEWDVVNEAVTDGTPYGYRSNDFWYQKLGDYIPLAFQWARAADPNAKLIYNDYGNEGLNAKSNYIYSMVSSLKSNNIPIDGVGWQCHVSSSWRLNDDIWENAQRLSALGLRVSVTELDVAIPVPVDAAKLQSQAKAYADMAFLCMTHPNIKRMFLWGFTDKYSWIPGFTNGASDAALIFDANYAKKPAYYAIESVLKMQPVNGIYNGGFESSIYCWNEMSGGTIAEETAIVRSGTKSARVYNRTQAYHGIGQYVLPYLLANGQGTYSAAVWARLASGTDTAKLTLYIKDDAGTKYVSLGSAAVNSTGWSEVGGSGNITWTGLLRVAKLFVETGSGTSTFYVDDLSFAKQGVVTPTNTAVPPTNTPTNTNTAVPPTNTPVVPTLTPTPVVKSTWRVLAGSAVSFTDSQGNVWAADSNYNSGTAFSTTNTVSNALPAATDMALYQSERYGSPFTYTFNVPAGTYQVTLKMAETYWTAAGQRTFNLLVNGTQGLTNFDLYSAAGGANKALDEVFNNISPVNGVITIQFGPASVDNAKVDAIQIIPQPIVPTNTPIVPTATPTTPVPTNTVIVPTATPTTPVPTNTVIVPTATPTTPVPTNTVIVPTATPTTPVPTNTPITPSATPTTPVPTNTPITPSPTPTTPVPTNTPVTPSATPTTPVPTNTPIIPTSTPTTPVTANITLQLKSGDINNSTSSPHPQIRIVNSGTTAINLNTVTARYWLNYDGTGQSMQAFVDYAGKMPQGTNVTSNVQASAVSTTLGGQTHYVRFTFTGGITLQPGEYIEVQARLNKSDWSAMLQSNDWSYAAYTSFTSWNKVTGYVNGTLVWGNEPSATAAASAQVNNVITYPNPATAATGATLSYSVSAPSGTGVSAQGVNDTVTIPLSGKVKLGIYTMAGRLIWQKTLEDASSVSFGEHAVYWDGKTEGGQGLAAGTYTLKVSLLSNSGSSSGYSTIIMLK